MYNKTKQKVHSLLHPELGDTRWDRIINASIISLILLNVVAVMLETEHSIYLAHRKLFHYFDLFTVVVFSVEYSLRVWSCTQEKKYHHSVWGRIRYMFTPGAIIDLLAILPFYIHMAIGLDLRVLRILRLFRFFRLFRLTSYMKTTKLIQNVFRTTLNQLALSFILAFTLIIISSSIIYFSEHTVQPDKFSSIPHTMWFSVVTLTTVGYGDMYPVTPAGKFFTSVILMVGVALFALPAGIITAGFLEETRKMKAHGHNLTCPHCNMPLDAEFILHEHEAPVKKS
jgi:voltage-gated potassium channel